MDPLLTPQGCSIEDRIAWFYNQAERLEVQQQLAQKSLSALTADAQFRQEQAVLSRPETHDQVRKAMRAEVEKIQGEIEELRQQIALLFSLCDLLQGLRADVSHVLPETAASPTLGQPAVPRMEPASALEGVRATIPGLFTRRRGSAISDITNQLRTVTQWSGSIRQHHRSEAEQPDCIAESLDRIERHVAEMSSLLYSD